jgi:hypothetical protein
MYVCTYGLSKKNKQTNENDRERFFAYIESATKMDHFGGLLAYSVD